MMPGRFKARPKTIHYNIMAKKEENMEQNEQRAEKLKALQLTLDKI